jgi:CBS domain-containing protein
MYLKDLCILDVAYCTRAQSITDAARVMRERHTGDLLVVDAADGEPRPIGVITDRDIVLEVLALGRDPHKTTVGEIMATRLIVASGEEDVATAIERMRAHGVRRLPIVDAREYLLGIITLDDLLHWLAQQTNALSGIVQKGQTREQRSKR